MSGKGKGKAKGKESGGGEEGGKVKAANHVKVRHILCEKQSKIQEVCFHYTFFSSFLYISFLCFPSLLFFLSFSLTLHPGPQESH